jgi:hypothetical protein
VQETHKRSQSPNSKAALRALLGVEFQATAGTPAHIALHEMREVLLRPGMNIAASAKAHHSCSMSEPNSANFQNDRQLSAIFVMALGVPVSTLD